MKINFFDSRFATFIRRLHSFPKPLELTWSGEILEEYENKEKELPLASEGQLFYMCILPQQKGLREDFLLALAGFSAFSD